MRKTTLAVVISSVLAGATAVAQTTTPTTDPAMDRHAQSTSQMDQHAQSTSQTDTTRPATTSPAPDADTAKGTNTVEGAGGRPTNVDVGAPRSNVDDQSSSGAYYPYSAGTVGDDPSDPKRTAVDLDAIVAEGETGRTDNWTKADYDGDGYLSQDELAKVAPKLSPNFSAMDVDNDMKLTRDELRNWHQSHKARMEADQGATSSPLKPDATSPGNSGD